MTALSDAPLFRSVRWGASRRDVPAPPDQRLASTDAFADQRKSSRSSAGLDPPKPSPPSTRIPARACARARTRKILSPTLGHCLSSAHQFVETTMMARLMSSGSSMASQPPEGSHPSGRNGRSAPTLPPSADGFATEDRSDRSPSNGEAPRGPRCCRRPAGSFREWRSEPG